MNSTRRAKHQRSSSGNEEPRFGLVLAVTFGLIPAMLAACWDLGTDAPASSALFKTGFEQDTELSVVESYNENGTFVNFNMFQYFSGQDDSTGYSWPPDLSFADPEDPIKINNIVGFDNINETNYYMENVLTDVVGPHGDTTRALSMNMKHNPEGTNVGQNDLIMMLDDSKEAPPLYIRYWMKPSKEIYANLTPGEWTWHMISELKAGMDGAFRFQIMISTNKDDETLPYYQLRADHCGPVEGSDEFICTNPEYWSHIIELTDEEHQKWRDGEWMPVEIYLSRNPDDDTDGRFYFAINGRTIGDLSARDNVFWDDDHTYQSFWILQLLYGLRTVEHGVFLDDLELWSDFPCSEPPCVEP